MNKKIIGIILCGLISATMLSCSSKKSESDTPDTKISSNENNNIQYEDQWSDKMTSVELNEKYNTILQEVKNQTEEYGLEYSEANESKEEDGNQVNGTYIYLDNENAEDNKLESLYFGMDSYGKTTTSGKIFMKMSVKINKKEILDKGEFNFGDLSLATYSKLFTNAKDRDYNDINKKIVNILKNEGEGVFTEKINGLSEEYSVGKDYIVYKLETKKYKFNKDGE